MRDGKIWSLIKQTSALENGIALASGMFIVVMTSGIMWCTIRKPPVMADQIFAAVNNIHSQYFMESYIILACNLASTIAILSLSDVLPRMNWSSHFKFFLTLLLLGMIVFGIRMEMALFKLKLPSYPFRILF